ncbi:zf-HC2 domain-containing protein [Maribacter sp. 2-571]|uniref:zf-HC2 domain-containing protein n=1 Tax=Maribacter sp. 2-571 TaxID=3417569 RepID=UPI003D3417A6
MTDENHTVDAIPAYLDGQLSPKEAERLERHLQTCESCMKELQAYRSLFNAIDEDTDPVPTPTLRNTFFAQLAAEKETEGTVSILPMPRQKPKAWGNRIWKVAASVLLLLGAYGIGSYQQRTSAAREIALLKQEELQAKQSAMLSLMENTSASKRIQGVAYIEAFEKPDADIVRALILRMQQDENTNVRLTALEALSHFGKMPLVKTAYIDALAMEKNPTIQIALIQHLVQLQEKKAIAPMKALLKKEETQPFIKEQIKKGLPQLL